MSIDKASAKDRSKRRGCLTNALLAIASTLVTLMLLDAGLRIVWRARIFSVEHRKDVPQVYRFPPGESRREVVHGDELGPDDPILESWEVDWVTDEYGYRNDAIPAQIDTLVLGDSFGVLPVSTPDLLASRLGGCGRSVYNLSMSAHGPWQEYATLILEQDRLKTTPGAALIWMLYSGNDLDDVYVPAYGETIKTELTRQGPGPVAWYALTESPLLQTVVGVLLPHPTRVEDPQGRSFLFYKPYIEHAQRTADDVRAHANYPSLRDTFRALAEDARQRQMRPLVIVIPSKEEIYYHGKASGFGEAVGELAAENDMDMIDLTPEFLKRAAEGEVLYLLQDTHWNADAQQIAARLVCDWLAQ